MAGGARTVCVWGGRPGRAYRNELAMYAGSLSAPKTTWWCPKSISWRPKFVGSRPALASRTELRSRTRSQTPYRRWPGPEWKNTMRMSFGTWHVVCALYQTTYMSKVQCTIRAPARDRESHAGPGSRMRSGVACGISSWRGHCGGGSHPTCSKGRSASLAKRGSLGAEAYGDPTRNPMRDPGSRSGSVVPWAIECESRDKRKLSCNAKSLPDGCALEDGSGIYRIF